MIRRCRIILTSIWWSGGAILVIVMTLLLSGGDAFGANDDPIGWLLPHVVPTMGLTGAAAFLAVPGKAGEADKQSLKFLFRLAAAASLFYLAILLAFIFMSLNPPEGMTVLERLAGWNAPLGVIQGIAASAIGVFFAKN